MNKKKVVGSIFVCMLMCVTVSTVTGTMNADFNNVENTERILFEPNTASANRAWSDNFDSYAAGSSLHGQGGWEAWDNNPATTVYVTDDQSRSSPNSVDIAWFSGVSGDIVQQFTDVNSGNWRLLAWQYVPGDMMGQSDYILMNTYSHGGPHNSPDWSLELAVSASTGLIWDLDNTADSLLLITDEWVLIRVEIDFEADLQEVYYGGELLLSKSWTAGVAPGGAKNFACVDLYADLVQSSSVYYDDFSLDVPQPLSCDANGPYEGLVDEDIEMDGTATGGLPPYQYLWDFGDGNTSDDQHPTHNYANAGIYTVSLTVTDGEQSTAFDETTATINGPPNEPTITGPTDGDAGTSYPYDFVAEDPDLDDIAEFLVDWDDGNQETITGPFASGETATKSHTFSTGGTFEITARAKDVNGLIGPEGTLTVTMPRNRLLPNTFFLRLLERFPNAFPILQRLLLRL